MQLITGSTVGKHNRKAYSYSIAWTSQFYFCSLPLRLDSYKSCNFGCRYCFVSHRGGHFRLDHQVTADVARFKRYLEQSLKLNTEAMSAIAECLQHRLPMHFGGMSDPFRQGELEERISYHLLVALCELGYPTVISTKSNLPAIEPYLSILKSMKNIAVQFSFSTLDDDLASKTEPYATMPSARLQAMHSLSEAGLWVGCRLQPFVPSISGPIPYVISKLAEVGTRHVTIEHLKLGLFNELRVLHELQKHYGTSFCNIYNLNNLKLKGTEYELLPRDKIGTLVWLAEETKKYGLTLGIGDNDFHDLGDSPNCCGVGELPGFENYFRHNITNAIWKGRNDSFTTLASISNEWAPTHSVRRYMNSKCRDIKNTEYKCYTVHDYLRQKWNSPHSLHSPCECCNVVPTGLKDQDGNLLYKYQQTFKLD